MGSDFFKIRVIAHATRCLVGAAIVLAVISHPSVALQQSPDEDAPEKQDQDPRWHAFQIVPDQRSRTYVVYVPNSYDGQKPVPLVLALHGTAVKPRQDLVKSGKLLIKWVKFDLKAETEGFIVVAPMAVGLALNDGSGRAGPGFDDVNDVRFIEAVIKDMSNRFAIDEDRVYAAGISSGASMAQRLAVELPNRVAAFAGVAGHLWAEGQSPTISRPVFLLFGTEDPLNPVDGGKIQYKTVVLDKPAPEMTAANWANRLKCSSVPAELRDEGDIRVVSWRPCDNGAEVIFYAIDGLGHQWPGGIPLPEKWKKFLGEYSDVVNATDLIWDFFSRHKRR